MALIENHPVMQEILEKLSGVVGQRAKFWHKGQYHDGFVTAILCGGDETPGMESTWLDWDVEVTTRDGLKGRTGISDLIPQDQLDEIWDNAIFTLVDPRLSPYRPYYVGRQRVEQMLAPIMSIRRDMSGTLHLNMEWGNAQEEAAELLRLTKAQLQDPEFWRIFQVLKNLNPKVYLGGPAIPTPPYERSFWLDDLSVVLEEIESRRYSGVLCRNVGSETSRSELARQDMVCTATEFVFE